MYLWGAISRNMETFDEENPRQRGLRKLLWDIRLIAVIVIGGICYASFEIWNRVFDARLRDMTAREQSAMNRDVANFLSDSTAAEIGKMKVAKVIQPIICFPNMISIIVISYLVYAFLGTNGFINNTILGGQGISWYRESKYWPVILTIVHFWQVAGYSSIIYIATMSGIDAELYEAAKLDGANKMQQIFHITLPLIRPTVILMLLMSVGRIFNSDFGLFLQVPMNSGMLYPTTQTIDTYSYRALMELNDVGKSSATGVFQSVLGFALVVISNLIVRKVDPDSALF